MLDPVLVPATVLGLFALALLAPWVGRAVRGAAGPLFALYPAAAALFFASRAGQIAQGRPVTASLDWVPSLGVNLAFHVDGLALLFALLICGIGALVLIYAGGYLRGHPGLPRFYAFLLLFMGAMLGLVLAGNVLTLFVFWELTSISSYLLIGFDHERRAARSAALQALLVTGGGGLALLIGLLLLGQVAGTYDLPELLGRGDAVRGDALYLPILLLVLAGAFTKSAQFPFHFWLPGAMEAPTPVSAYLHSATMVKAGVYLLARLSPGLGGTEPWLWIVTGAGLATTLVGGFLALYRTDLKQILAYSTVSALGTLVLLLGLGTERAAKAAMVFLLAHALYKGAMFMIAGAVDHETGTRDVERLGGLRRAMPVTAWIALLAAVSLAGFGPVFSFIGKEMLLEAVLESPARLLLAPAAVIAGALFVAVAGIVGVRPFFIGTLKETPKHPHEAPPSLWLGPALLAVLGLVLGLFPRIVSRSLVAPAAASVLGRAEPVDLALWHGINAALGLSVVSVAVGLLLYRGWAALRHTTTGVERFFAWGPVRFYNLGLDALNRIARAQTRLIQNGNLRHYLLTIMGTTAVLVLGTLASDALARPFPAPRDGLWADLRAYEALIAVLILAAAITAVRMPHRLGAVAALGVVGYGVALLYILFGAPDLAMTQFMIETLTVLLFVFVFYHLPRFGTLSSRPAHVRDALVALAFGGMITALILAAAAVPPDLVLTPYFAENSRPLAHGRNIVNVILVDFRGIDTLGEITVLAIAAVGVHALLKLRPGGRPDR